MHMISTNKRHQTITVATIISAIANVLLAISKIVIGYFGFSQALIADGVHSFSDLITDALVLIASRMGAQTPDQQHPYGHRRIETIGAIILAVVIIFIALGIAYDTIHHLISHLQQRPHILVIIAAIISIIVNEALYFYSYRQGRKVQSELLITNAWHHRSDALVSAIVLLSAIGAMFGVYFLDAIGALLIAALIFYMGVRMIWKNTGELIDSGVDEETLKKIQRIILCVPGIISVHQLRTRSHSGYIFIDVHIQVDPTISVSEGHYISEQVILELVKNMPQVQDVTVHIDSENDEQAMLSMNLPNRIYLQQLLRAQWQQLPGYEHIRRLNLHYLAGQLYIEVYLPYEILQFNEINTMAAIYQQAARNIPEIASVTLYYE